MVNRPRWISNWWKDGVFQIAKYANRLWELSDKNDVLYAGDDVRFFEPDTCKRLQAAAYARDSIGIIAPRVDAREPRLGRFTGTGFVPFICVYIKREVIDAVGFLDERFTGYGCEDVDFCYRARKAGFEVGYANDIAIRHGIGATYASTFRRVKSEAQIWKEDAENWKRFGEKWGLTGNRAQMLNAVLKA